MADNNNNNNNNEATRIIIDTIFQRLNEWNLQTRHIRVNYVGFLSQNVDVENLEDLCNRHFLIDDQQLCTLLNLTESTVDDVIDDDVPRVFYYVRSWRLTRDELSTLYLDWEDEQIYQNYTTTLENILAANPNVQNFYIRYVGMCRSPTRPIDRMMRDATLRNTGLLGEFLNYCDENIPLFQQRAHVFTFNDAPQRAFDEMYTSRVEQALIAFFGINNLLNTAPGGFNFEYIPVFNEYRSYRELNQTFFADVEVAENRQIDIRITERLREAWIPSIREIMANNTEITLQERYPFSEEYLNMTMNQATPTYSYNGHVLVTMIGRDVTRSAYLNAIPFLNLDSQAGFVTCNYLSVLRAWQNEQHQDIEINALGYNEIFPFVDLYPWLGKTSTFSFAIEQLNLYLDIVRPLVAITFSRPVTSCAFTSFVHEHGLQHDRASYINCIGLPTVRNFDTLGWINRNENDEVQPSPVCSVIVLPLFHPGVDKHTNRSPDYIRLLMLITYEITLCVLSIAHRIALNEADRETAIAAIMNDCGVDTTQDANLQLLYRRLAALKEEYLNNDRVIRRTPGAVQQITRDRISNALINRIDAIGRAAGNPNSNEREDQVRRLWRMNLQDLHVAIPRDNEQGWSNWARNLERGTSFFASARENVVNPVHPYYHLLVNNAPIGVDAGNDDWMTNPALVDQVLSIRGRQMFQQRFANKTPAEISAIQRRVAFGRLNANYPVVVQGSHITLRQDLRANLRWKVNGDFRKALLDFSDRPLLVQAAADNNQVRDRVVSFTPNGILFTIQDRQVADNQPEAVQQLLFDRNQISQHTSNIHLIELYTNERQRLNPDGEEDLIQPVDIGRELKNIRNIKIANRLRDFPIRQTDALWLLKQFLDDVYPNNGLISFVPQACIARNWHQGDVFSQILTNYLNQNHLQHPRNRYLVDLAANEPDIRHRDFTRNSTIFVYNIHLLRPLAATIMKRQGPRTKYQTTTQFQEITLAGADHRTMAELTEAEQTANWRAPIQTTTVQAQVPDDWQPFSQQ